MHKLAKIRLDEDEKRELEQYKKELLDYLKILDELDMDFAYEKVELAENNVAGGLDTLCNDEAEDSLHEEGSSKNAPKLEGGFFVV